MSFNANEFNLDDGSLEELLRLCKDKGLIDDCEIKDEGVYIQQGSVGLEVPFEDVPRYLRIAALGHKRAT